MNSDDIEPVVVINQRKPWFGGDGIVQLEACIQNPLVCAGSQVFVEVRVKNESRRRVSVLFNNNTKINLGSRY